MSRRTPWIVAGIIVMAAIAAPVVIAGTAMLALFGSAGQLRTGPHVVTTPGRALVSSVAEIDSAAALASALGDNRVEIQGTARSADHGVFVGIAPAAAVDRYLAGADVDVVTDFEVSPFRLTTRHQPGNAVLRSPGSQSFWVARAEARSGTARLSWPVQDGDYRVVLMNADGSPGVDVDGRFAVVVPSAFGISMTVLATGLGLALLGLVLLTLGLSAPRSPRPPASWPGSVPPPVPAPGRPPVPTAAPRGGVSRAPADTNPERNQP
jgi:hypothetical protein